MENIMEVKERANGLLTLHALSYFSWFFCPQIKEKIGNRRILRENGDTISMFEC